MKIALFENVEYKTKSVWEAGNHEDGPEAFMPKSYVRISDWIDVEFPSRLAEEVLSTKLARLDKAEQEIHAKFHEALTAIKQRKQELLALTHEPTIEGEIR